MLMTGLMKDGPPWTAYAEPDAPFVPGAAWGEQTIRFHARHTAGDARLTLFLGGALPPGSVLLLQPGTLVSATCSQPVPLSADVGNIIFYDAKDSLLRLHGRDWTSALAMDFNCRLAPDSPARAISDGGLPPGALP